MPARQLQKSETRTRVLNAAREIFAERGFEGTTMKAVAERSEVAVGTLFVHVADKGALLQEALHDDLQRVLTRARASAPHDGRDRLLHLAKHLYRYYAKQPALSVVLVQQSLFVPTAPDSLSANTLQDFLGDVADTIVRNGTLHDGVTALDAATAFFGLYLTVLLRGLRAPDMKPDRMVQELDALLSVTFPAKAAIATRSNKS
jgi:AcrR family transcriptional regulator